MRDMRGEGFGFCNPAYADSRKLTNREYLDTIPDDDPWKSVLDVGFGLMDQADPEWRVRQIKEKFGECRFYIDGNEIAQDLSRLIERICDSK